MVTTTRNIRRAIKFFFKEEGKDKWSGPAKVTGQEGSKIRIIHAGYDRTVPACRVIPKFPDKVIVEEDPNSSYGIEEEKGADGQQYSQGMETDERMVNRPKDSQRK